MERRFIYEYLSVVGYCKGPVGYVILSSDAYQFKGLTNGIPFTLQKPSNVLRIIFQGLIYEIEANCAKVSDGNKTRLFQFRDLMKKENIPTVSSLEPADIEFIRSKLLSISNSEFTCREVTVEVTHKGSEVEFAHWDGVFMYRITFTRPDSAIFNIGSFSANF